MGHLILVRHGQASFGTDDYDVLSERGWEQSRLLGAWLREQGVSPTAIIHGSMRRHRETAEGVMGAAGWNDLVVAGDPGWDEFDHVGLVAGHPDLADGATDVRSVDRRRFQEIFEDVTARWTAGDQVGALESYADFLLRVRTSLARAMKVCGSGETVVVVTSGGPIAAVAASLVDPEGTDPGSDSGSDSVGDPAAQAVTARLWSRFNTVSVNAAYTRVLVGSTGARLLTFNEHHHLRGEQVTYR